MENIEDLQARLAASENREKELAANVEELSDFLENASFPLHRVDAKGVIIWANQAELDFLGYTREEYIGHHISDFHADQVIVNTILQKLSDDETLQNHPAIVKCKDGSVREVLINSSVYRKDGEFIHTRCFTRDVTALNEEARRKEELSKQLEVKNQVIRESEERFRALANTAPVLLWMSGTDKQCYFLNKSWLDFTGRTMEEEIGSGWTENIHPDDFQRCMHIYSSNFDLQEPFYMEYRLKRHDGEYRWVSDNGAPRFSHDGNFLGFVGGCMDIHERRNFSKELEYQVEERTEQLRNKNQELEHSNEELTSFSYAAGHDLHAPLRKIAMYCDLLTNKKDVVLSEDVSNYITRINAAVSRMQVLIDSLLEYSRAGSTDAIREQTDLNELYEEVRSNMHDLLVTQNVDISSGPLPVLHVVPLQFQQVFVNLISNSVKYRHADIHPVIRISAEIVSGRDIPSEKADPALNYHKLRFEDNGIGFEQQYERKIFELFQRLHGKHEYEGTGIGLGIVKKVVLNHRGIITAKGIPGEGAVFDIYLPRLDE